MDDTSLDPSGSSFRCSSNVFGSDIMLAFVIGFNTMITSFFEALGGYGFNSSTDTRSLKNDDEWKSNS